MVWVWQTVYASAGRKKYWICDLGVESFVSSKIAEEIDHEIQYLGLEDYTIYPEATLNSIFENDTLESKSVAYVSPGQRLDLAVLGPGDQVEAVIEIKRHAAMDGLYKDIMTLSDIVGGVYRGYDRAPLGVSCVFLDASPGERSYPIDDVVENIRSEITAWYHDELLPDQQKQLNFYFVEGPTMTFHSEKDDFSEWNGWKAKPLCTVIEKA